MLFRITVRLSSTPIAHFPVKKKKKKGLIISIGVRAAQVVPHVHFHIVPRPPLDQPASANKNKTSYIMFGKGQRDELDEEEGEVLAGEIRGELAREVRRVRDVEGVDLEGDSGVERKRRGVGKL